MAVDVDGRASCTLVASRSSAPKFRAQSHEKYFHNKPSIDPDPEAALSALYYIGIDGLAAPSTSGDGVTFMLHRVSPEPVRAFEPNRILKITPDFLDNVVLRVIEAGIDLLSMDDVPERLAARRSARPFACFTLVDGYRDNLEYALPVFMRYGAPSRSTFRPTTWTVRVTYGG
jgi:hypothetical protein